MIHVLEKSVADKIAAGEVIERPLSIVKELVENSIDAGAGSITVEIKKGGKTYIRVTDDGCGIESGQAETAFLRHATSKISQAGDLEHIRTLGFRGEALASIAAVSRTEMITKTREEKTGTRLVIEGGAAAMREATGCPEGTTIVVRDLFYNTPARRKFLRTDAAESSAIIRFVSQMALAYPRLRVRMISGGNMLFSTPGKGDRYQNILTVFSKDLGNELIPVETQEGELRLEGYISNPGESRATRKQQIFFVNGRAVDSGVIGKGVGAAYADKLFEGRFPVAFLFLFVPPDSLDVNIHPNKREIRFHDETVITEFVNRSLRQALRSRESIPQVRERDFAWKLAAPTAASAKPPADSFSPSPAADRVATPQEEQVDIKKLLSNLREEETARAPSLREEPAAYRAEPFGETNKTPPPFDFDALTVTGCIFGTYITAVDEDCFYLIDQHAAHERILFERLMKQYREREKHCQPILLPITLSVSYDAAENGAQWLSHLNQMGFQAEVFGPRTYRVTGIPAFMKFEEAERFLKDFAEQADSAKAEPLSVIETIIMRSCKSAVKAHDYLKDEEIRRLLADLRQCENPFSCPHGRPTFIKMTQYEIEKMFKRV